MSAGFEVVLDAEDGGATVAKALRRHHPEGLSWEKARRLVRSGAVTVGGEVLRDPAARVEAGATLAFGGRGRPPEHAAGVRAAGVPALAPEDLFFVDADLVVVRKPAGVATVPFEDQEPVVLADLVVAALRTREGRKGPRPGVVHRLDKMTSGVLVMSRRKSAWLALKDAFRKHAVERSYLALVYGIPRSGNYVSRLVPDRGDGYRGSTRRPGAGRESTTRVAVLERLIAPGIGPVSLVRCTLETGRTHQIRIQLSEAGHPLLGDPVYQVAAARRGWNAPLPGSDPSAGRLALHAAVLGFDHPRTGERLRFEDPLPPDLAALVERLRGP